MERMDEEVRELIQAPLLPQNAAATVHENEKFNRNKQRAFQSPAHGTAVKEIRSSLRQRIDMGDSQSVSMVDRIVGTTSEIPGYALRRDYENEAQSIISTNKL